MPKRKKYLPAKRGGHIGKAHHKRHHKGKMGAIDSAMLTHETMVLLGLTVGQIGASVIQKNIPNMNPKIVGLVDIVGGITLKNMFPGSFMNGFGYGLAGTGVMSIAHDSGFIHGVEEVVQDLMKHGYGKENVTIIHPPDTRGAIIKMSGNQEAIYGLSNADLMSGISNADMISNMGESPTMQEMFEQVRPLGM